MTAETKPKSKAGSIGAALIIIAVIIGVFAMAFHFVNEQQKALDEGCEPLTWNSWGIAASYRCPEGVDINND